MKTKLPTGLCVLIALVLVAFGLLYGTYAGFSQDKAQVETLLHNENGLLTVLSYRGADGLNLCVVASRHLNVADEQVLSLERAGRTLAQSADLTLAQLNQADRELENAVAAVRQTLSQTPSFQASTRDQKYVDMILADLNSLSASAAVTTYNREAARFNDQLSGMVGRFAQWMGIESCTLYE